MPSISKEDYLKLLEEIVAEEHDSDDSLDSIPDDSWIWGDSPAKDKIRRNIHHGLIDVSKFKKDKIQDALYKCMNIKVFDFTIRITQYHGYPDKFSKGSNLTMDIEIWEKRYKTPTGHPCNMDFRIDWSADDRFFGRQWLAYFQNGASSSANDVPVETVVDIVKWMQAIKKMSAFL